MTICRPAKEIRAFRLVLPMCARLNTNGQIWDITCHKFQRGAVLSMFRVRYLVPGTGICLEQYSHGARGKRVNRRMGHGVRAHMPGGPSCGK